MERMRKKVRKIYKEDEDEGYNKEAKSKSNNDNGQKKVDN